MTDATRRGKQPEPSPANPLPDFPANLLEFQRMFADEEACRRYLELMRWPSGFTCERCGVSEEPLRLATRTGVLKCRSCLQQTRLTAGTIMQDTRTPLQVWFWAAYLVSTQTSGISALELQKQLGISRYETAFQMLHKLRATMVRPDRDPIGAQWPIEMDIAFVGGKHKGGGSGKTDKTPVIIAVEVRQKELRDPQTAKLVKRALAGRVRLRKLPNKSAAQVDGFAKDCIAPGAHIATDDGGEFEGLPLCGYHHRPLPMLGNRARMDAWLPLVSTVTANLKAWLDGTFHGVSKPHLQAYLNEFMFRFNRRFYRPMSFRTLLGLGLRHTGPTYRALYDRDWVHLENPPADAVGASTG